MRAMASITRRGAAGAHFATSGNVRFTSFSMSNATSSGKSLWPCDDKEQSESRTECERTQAMLTCQHASPRMVRNTMLVSSLTFANIAG